MDAFGTASIDRGNLIFHRWALALGTIGRQNWERGFWIRIKGLPLHFWTSSQLEGIAKACGGLLAIDPLTANQEDCRWA